MSTPQKDILIILRAEAKEQERNSKYFTAEVFQQAANEIERLQAALAPFIKLSEQAMLVDGRERWTDESPVYQVNCAKITVADCKRALKCQE